MKNRMIMLMVVVLLGVVSLEVVMAGYGCSPPSSNPIGPLGESLFIDHEKINHQRLLKGAIDEANKLTGGPGDQEFFGRLERLISPEEYAEIIDLDFGFENNKEEVQRILKGNLMESISGYKKAEPAEEASIWDSEPATDESGLYGGDIPTDYSGTDLGDGITRHEPLGGNSDTLWEYMGKYYNSQKEAEAVRDAALEESWKGFLGDGSGEGGDSAFGPGSTGDSEKRGMEVEGGDTGTSVTVTIPQEQSQSYKQGEYTQGSIGEGIEIDGEFAIPIKNNRDEIIGYQSGDKFFGPSGAEKGEFEEGNIILNPGEEKTQYYPEEKSTEQPGYGEGDPYITDQDDGSKQVEEGFSMDDLDKFWAGLFEGVKIEDVEINQPLGAEIDQSGETPSEVGSEVRGYSDTSTANEEAPMLLETIPLDGGGAIETYSDGTMKVIPKEVKQREETAQEPAQSYKQEEYTVGSTGGEIKITGEPWIAPVRDSRGNLIGYQGESGKFYNPDGRETGKFEEGEIRLNQGEEKTQYYPEEKSTEQPGYGEGDPYITDQDDVPAKEPEGNPFLDWFAGLFGGEPEAEEKQEGEVLKDDGRDPILKEVGGSSEDSFDREPVVDEPPKEPAQSYKQEEYTTASIDAGAVSMIDGEDAIPVYDSSSGRLIGYQRGNIFYNINKEKAGEFKEGDIVLDPGEERTQPDLYESTEQSSSTGGSRISDEDERGTEGWVKATLPKPLSKMGYSDKEINEISELVAELENKRLTSIENIMRGTETEVYSYTKEELTKMLKELGIEEDRASETADLIIGAMNSGTNQGVTGGKDTALITQQNALVAAAAAQKALTQQKLQQSGLTQIRGLQRLGNEIDKATDGWGTDEEAIKKAFESTESREEAELLLLQKQKKLKDELTDDEYKQIRKIIDGKGSLGENKNTLLQKQLAVHKATSGNLKSAQEDLSKYLSNNPDIAAEYYDLVRDSWDIKKASIWDWTFTDTYTNRLTGETYTGWDAYENFQKAQENYAVLAAEQREIAERERSAGMGDWSVILELTDEEEKKIREETKTRILDQQYKQLLNSQAQQLTSELLNTLLGEFAYGQVQEWCKEEWDASEPNSKTPVDTPPGPGTTNNSDCPNNLTTFSAQGLKTNISTGYQYDVSWTIRACKEDIKYNIYLANSKTDREALGLLTTLKKGKVNGETKQFSLSKEYQSTCFMVSDTTVGDSGWGCFDFVETGQKNWTGNSTG